MTPIDQAPGDETSSQAPQVTPGTPEEQTGSATTSQGANTNLDPNLQGGPATAEDRAASAEVTEQHAEG